MCGASAGLTLLTGLLTGAHAVPAVWWLTLLGCLLGSAVFAVYGLAVGLSFRAESAVGAASAGMVFFSFLGNVFMPLSGAMLAVAHYTPMYGVMALIRWSQVRGDIVGDNGLLGHDPVWQLLLNVAAWLTLFAVVALRGVRASRVRR